MHGAERRSVYLVILLRSVTRQLQGERTDFPFTVPTVRALQTLTFDASVSMFVGENGSGKSTLLESMAAALNLPTIGATAIARDDTLTAQRELGAAFRLRWDQRTTRGFFLRAEDFFGYAQSLAKARAELLTEASEVEAEYRDRSALAKALRMGPINNSLAEMERRYGTNLDANSHGQSFLKLFQSRLVTGGLFLLDEPETPLSPQNQLGLMAMMREFEPTSQFIVATHSPILLSYPGAAIYSFDDPPIRRIAYDDVEHVTLTREFLNNPTRYLHRIMESES